MKRPNILIILTDDQGYGDLSCMGDTTCRTPHLDQLARDGVRCTSWYSGSSVCSPARACLLTGRYPGHAGVRSILAGHRTASGLPASVPTLATMLSQQGWSTFLSGKWHLGTTPESRPESHGFQRSFGFLAGCVDFFSHISYWGMNRPGPGVNPLHDLWEDGKEVWNCGEYLTEAITARSIDFIRAAHSEDKPFFGYVAYNAPHYPMHAPAKYHERFAHLPWDKRIMAAMISAVDDGVGEIRAELARLGLDRDTIIIFSSDNGPSRESRNWLDGTQDPYYGGTTDGLRGHKFSLFEGGIRVPGIVCYPSTIPAGQVCTEAVGSVDVVPTLLAACGIDHRSLNLDGTDIGQVLAGKSPVPERDLFWELGEQTAIRRGPWKLVLKPREVEHADPVAEVFLANLDLDRSERQNRIADEPALAAELTAAATAWRNRLEARWATGFQHGTTSGVTALSTGPGP